MTRRNRLMLGTLGAVLLASALGVTQAQVMPQDQGEPPEVGMPGIPVPPMPPSPFRQPPAQEQAASPQQPLPPGARSAVGGAPYPSMVSPPGQTQGRPNVLLSSEPMRNNDQDMRQRLQRMSSDVETRMQGLRIGSGQLSPPSFDGRMGELHARASAERNIREFEVRQREMEAAIKLWATTYDPRREEEAARAQRERRAEAATPPGNRSPTPADVTPNAPPRNTATAPDANRQANRSDAPSNSGTGASSNTRRSLDVPMPKIVSITGGGDTALRATLLIPYIGEAPARIGTVLPGGRKVLRITEETVVVLDPVFGEASLGFGDSVPLTPPQPRTSTENARPTIGQPFSVPMPQPQMPRN
jgi:hypothetical protein